MEHAALRWRERNQHCAERRHYLGKPMKYLLVLFGSLLACAGAFAADTSEDVVVLCYHEVRDGVGTKLVLDPAQAAAAGITAPGVAASLDAEQFTTSTRNLAGHFDWLRSH